MYVINDSGNHFRWTTEAPREFSMGVVLALIALLLITTSAFADE